MNKERVTYTDEKFEGLEGKELLAYINYLQQKREDHKAAAEKLRQALDVTVAWTTWDQIACVVQECANGFDSADESWPSPIHRPTAVVYRNLEKRTKSESPFQDSITR